MRRSFVSKVVFGLSIAVCFFGLATASFFDFDFIHLTHCSK